MDGWMKKASQKTTTMSFTICNYLQGDGLSSSNTDTQTPTPLTHNHGVINLHLIFVFFGLSFDHDIFIPHLVREKFNVLELSWFL
jgi:hypothetical protein